MTKHYRVWSKNSVEPETRRIFGRHSDPAEALAADPRLETALLPLRVKLVGNLPWSYQLAAKAGADTP